MFLGEYEHTLDTKARLAIPARFRLQMGRGGVLRRGVRWACRGGVGGTG